MVFQGRKRKPAVRDFSSMSKRRAFTQLDGRLAMLLGMLHVAIAGALIIGGTTLVLYIACRLIARRGEDEDT